jgi:hypothetical protein
MGLVGTSSALAQSPWWHLTSGSRPTNLQRGLAKNEVQELTVSGNVGEEFVLADLTETQFANGEYYRDPQETEPLFANFVVGSEASVIQAGLEGLYGKGNVEVVGGPGQGGAPKPYRVTFTGALVDQQVRLINTGLTPGFFEGKVSVTQVSQGEADGEIFVTAENLGDASIDGITSVQIADALPLGLQAVGISGTRPNGVALNARVPLSCSLESLTCQLEATLAPYAQVEMRVAVIVKPGSSSGELNEVRLSGGGAQDASIKRPVTISDVPTSFGVEDYQLAPEEEGGAPDTQAGSHPFQLTTTLTLNQIAGQEPAALAKDLNFKLPAGLIGNPTPFPRCTTAQFFSTVNSSENLCPQQTVLGVAVLTFNEPDSGFDELTVPVFNLEPRTGEPARFGFYAVTGNAPVFLDTSVRTGGDYGVTVSVDNITQTAAFLSSEVTFWGVPGDPRHDNARGWGCLAEARGETEHSPCSPAEDLHPPPLLSLPTACAGPLQTSVEVDSWLGSGSFQSFPSSEPMQSLDGCNRLPFNPSIKVAPDGLAGSTPTGLTVDVHVPQELNLNAKGLSGSEIKDIKVTLPEGVVLNPAAADGLQACSEAQIGYLPAQSTPPDGLHFTSGLPAPKGAQAEPFCADAAKIATVKIKTPLLPNALEGAVYLAAQNGNPFGSLIAMYIVAEDPISGALVKLPGEVSLNQTTGQVTATFKDTPQLPFEDAELHFFGGDRAPLGTPALCGSYKTEAAFTPWSGNADSASSSTFDVTSGPNGAPCHSPLPFDPSLTAGSTSIQAGGFSPFTMTMSREDGQQNLQAITLHMPPGLSGLLSSVKLCGEPQADQGTCGPESEIGETIVSVGLGGDPFSVKGGKVFITEGYEGAPYGLSIVNPAKAGPFDLGQVVVRAKIEVDPITAALTITTDGAGPYKIPSILDGIPLQIKHVNVTINRPRFTFNPTNCNHMQITGSLFSTEGATSTLSVPLQVTNCAVLGFKPAFSVSTAGKTSRTKGASLHVKLTYPKAPFGSQANISKVKVDLPKQLPSRLTTLQKACPDSTFNKNPANCSAESRIGQARATTPLLPVPLVGPVYFVSHAGLKFPELVVVLSGYGTTIDLHAETFISPAGVTSSTFRTVPDAPVGTFELTLPQGKFSALAAPGNLCKDTLRMPTAFTAQNGATIKQSTPIIVTGCPKHKAKRAGKKVSAHKRKK